MNITYFEPINKTPIGITQEIRVKDLIADVCTQVDNNIIYCLLFILFMYIMDYILYPLLIKAFPKRKLLLSKINNYSNGIAFMSILYILYIAYIQIGFNYITIFVLSVVILIIFIGLISNFMGWIKIRKTRE